MKAQRLLGALLAIACLVPLIAHAQTAREMRKQVEGSMLVTGSIDIDRDGAITAHSIDQQEKLPPYVVSLIDRAVPALRFEPYLVDGAAVAARAKMSLRLVAAPHGESGDMNVGIRSAHFGEYDPTVTDEVRPAKRMTPPRYPESVVSAGGQGTAYLVLQIGRDGTVTDAVAEQVNLRVLGNQREMERIRRVLAQASLAAARKWTFTPPTTGEHVDAPYWSIRVPVDFMLSDNGRVGTTAYGTWEGYVPGPRQHATWVRDADDAGSPDALMADGGIYPASSPFKLLTPFES